jgi:hypothetical protein
MINTLGTDNFLIEKQKSMFRETINSNKKYNLTKKGNNDLYFPVEEDQIDELIELLTKIRDFR